MNTLLRCFPTLPVLSAVLLWTGCSTTQFTTTWKAPDARLTHLEAGARVGSLVIHPEVAVQRAAEDALAAELTKRGLSGVAAYSILGDKEPRDEVAAKEAFARAGADAVVVMRGVSEQTEVDYRSPTYYTVPNYRGFWGGYYGHSWDMVYEPGYLRTSKIVSVETLVYDLKSNQLVWGGRSRTVDPGKLESFIREIVDEAARKMRQDGVI